MERYLVYILISLSYCEYVLSSAITNIPLWDIYMYILADYAMIRSYIRLSTNLAAILRVIYLLIMA
jgi:hypothetical protein